MPYEIAKEGNSYVVKKKDGSKVFGTHPTHAKAVAQLRALYANTQHGEAPKNAREHAAVLMGSHGYKLEGKHEAKDVYSQGKHKVNIHYGKQGNVEHVASWEHSMDGKNAAGVGHHLGTLGDHLRHIHSQHEEDTEELQLAEHYQGQLYHSKVPRQSARNTFANIVAKHGGVHNKKNGRFHIPKHKVEDFHNAASQAGFEQEHHYGNPGQYSEINEQFSDLHREYAKHGLQRQADRYGLHRFAGKGHVIEVDPKHGNWTHYHNGKIKAEGEHGHGGALMHLEESSQHEEQDLVEVGHVSADRAKELCDQNPELWRS